MNYNYSERRTCPICGKADFCGYGNGQNGVISYCGRIKATKGEILVGADGNEYICIRPDGDMYCGWALKSNEDSARFNRTKNTVYRAIQGGANNKPKDVLETTKDAKRLNRVYTALLKNLVLEPEHEKLLREEWGDELFATLTSQYLIKSLPMDDFERFSYGKFYRSPRRKDIVEKMHAMGILKEDMAGVPGFYENSKTGKMTMYRLSGIVFSVYDGNGNIVRLRIKDDFPTAKGVYKGKEGNFFYSRKHYGWCFQAEGDEPELVYQPKTKNYKVHLDNAGIPLSDGGKKSKVEGKYKNFSSYKEYDDGGIIRNVFKNGTQSGSFPSLYTSSGDNTSIVFFTEGEKKGMVANKLLGYPVVCFPGVGTFKKAFEPLTDSGSLIESLLKMGMKKAVLVYDADKTSNVHVLQAEKNCVQWFLDHNIAMAIGEWDPRYGKGLDDILIKGIRPMLYDIK